jgi:hypothetical protein
MSVTAFKLPIRDDAAHESIADKIRRLRAEAQGHARSHCQDLVDKLIELEALVDDIAAGGEAYPVGIREAARKLAPDLMQARLNAGSILARDL